MANGAKIIGPYAPRDFSDLTTLNSTIQTDVAAAASGNTLAGAEPVNVLGNIFIVVSFA